MISPSPIPTTRTCTHTHAHLYARAPTHTDGGKGYRNDNTSGIAVGDEEESMYMVVDGRHYNEGCCFDYGNAEIG